METIIIKQGHRPKGYGFVAYGTLAEAENAIKNLDNKELDGREISVQLAKAKEIKPASSNAEKKKKKRNNRKLRKNVSCIFDMSSVQLGKMEELKFVYNDRSN